MKLSCFKAYDIRGRLGNELNEDIAYRIGLAYAQHLNAKRVVVGGDSRLTSELLKHALATGLMEGGADVIDIGMTGSEEVYFAAFYLDVDGGIEVTASHNPMDYNGMKLVGCGARPINSNNGLTEIQLLAENDQTIPSGRTGILERQSILEPYVEHLLSYINAAEIMPLRLVVNAGNGAAGHVIDAIEDRFRQLAVPISFIKIHHEPDGTFPNGIPNPLLPENREVTSIAVVAHKADMGIAWDGDFDRCFMFDEKGQFIEAYYLVGLLAETFLNQYLGEKVIHDPRLTWNTIEIAQRAGGVPIQCRTGHAFMKEKMRAENAIYGGEMSGHHYFRDFAYCDSGMIPWLLVAALMSRKRATLSSLVGLQMTSFPCSGELNFRVDDVEIVLARLQAKYSEQAVEIDRMDGLGMTFKDWRFNVRASNTEPLLRLNIEARGKHGILAQQIAEMKQLILGGEEMNHTNA